VCFQGRFTLGEVSAKAEEGSSELKKRTIFNQCLSYSLSVEYNSVLGADIDYGPTVITPSHLDVGAGHPAIGHLDFESA
jgi:hypothetical protein